MGLWGPNPFTSGVDPDYMKAVEENIVRRSTPPTRLREP